ncbi:hypothetical protein OESDEN_20927 [Oesophagostomum dentatum]|uniref:Uncharacterized protein n=1 Tax=Oesophagostomum dentatum TaxID=61180 RepID=A0A0B1S7C4_OESDE|nr:hypothetical protein OESDEN_20927 [Oesophagostomum dentatum]
MYHTKGTRAYSSKYTNALKDVCTNDRQYMKKPTRTSGYPTTIEGRSIPAKMRQPCTRTTPTRRSFTVTTNRRFYENL